MVPESDYHHMKAKIPEIKQLFQSRRYIQCASVCERYLIRGYDEIHPVHRAYLHFYFALVHDTMARETTLKHRSSGLDLAEQHYRAAIDILTPSEPYNLDDILSPSSPKSEEDQVTSFRRMSNHSYQSTASSTSSLDDVEERAWNVFKSPQNIVHRPVMSHQSSFRPEKRRPAPIMTINAARAYHEEQFSADLFSFLAMIHSHLHEVQQLKSASPAVRFSFVRSRSSTTSSRPVSRDSSNSSNSDMEQLRWARKSVSFRPRFDPASIQNLCNEVLAEL
ncbi:hypothetical protein N0V90_012182 [Kalmusia sp. IMI 367209]|nr:hypothetical protein N0V90_012182 [Kalmusia sp. IMI 367209]